MGRLNRDGEYLATLRDYFAQHRVLPSYAAISQALGFRSKNAALLLAGRLQDAGFLSSGPGGRLVPGERFFERPMLDESVSAGAGEPAPPQGSGEFCSIDQMLIRNPSRTVLIRVSGDSMMDAGVLDGDTAIVEQSAQAIEGDFVVALVDGRYTFKELRFRGRTPVLVPHNRRYKTIVPRADLSIVGVVRGIVRSYRENIKPRTKAAGGQQR